MGPSFTIVIADTISANTAQEVITAFTEIARIEGLMSEWRPDSEISAINDHAGIKPITVSQETFTVLKAARQLGERSDGAFDPTWAALRGIWRFDLDPPQLPLRSVLEATLKQVGYEHLVLDESKSTVFLKAKGAALGLGAIAKGYGIDRAVQVLQSFGLKNFIVDGGGDLRLVGHKPSGPWTVGIQHPRREDTLLMRLPARNQAVVTSGDYQRYFILGERRYHHIINLKTGMPSEGVVAVTVLAPSAMLADALATALFNLGPEAGASLLKKYPGTGALILTPDQRIHTLGEIHTAVPNSWNIPTQAETE